MACTLLTGILGNFNDNVLAVSSNCNPVNIWCISEPICQVEFVVKCLGPISDNDVLPNVVDGNRSGQQGSEHHAVVFPVQ